MSAVGDALSAIDDGVTSAAVLVGGSFAYFKFLRGRTFSYRAEAAVTADLLSVGGRGVMQVAVECTNNGLGRLPLARDGGAALSAVRLYGVTAGVDWWVPGDRIVWGDQLSRTSVFDRHAWIEPNETISEKLLIPVAGTAGGFRYLAYRVELRIISAQRRSGRGIRWSASTIVIPPAGQEQDGPDPMRPTGREGEP